MRLLLRRPYTTLGVLFVIALGVPFVLRTSDWHTVYLPAARRLLARGDLYDPTAGYTYPPAMAWLAIPFTFLPKRIAGLAWYLVNAASLAIVWLCAWRVAGGASVERSPVGWREHAVLWAGLLLSLRFVTDTLDHQQTDLLVAALSLGGCHALWRGRVLAAGVWFGLGAGIKATPVLWSAYLLWRRQVRAAIMVGAVAVFINVLPQVFFPSPARPWLQQWGIHLRYVLTELPPGLWAAAPLYNQSLSGTVFRFANREYGWRDGEFIEQFRSDRLALTAQRLLVYGSAVMLLLAAAAAMARAPSDSGGAVPRLAIEGAVVLMLMVLLSPASSKPHFVTVILPAFVLARLALYERRRGAALCLSLAFACAVASNRMIVGERLGLAALWLGGVTWCALALLVGCLSALVFPSPAVKRVSSESAAAESHTVRASRARHGVGNASARQV